MGTSEGPRSVILEAVGGTESERVGLDTADTLDLLCDDVARELVGALGGTPRSATALAERIDASRATVYRRLDSLEAAGLIESRVAIDGDGHHRKRFRVAIEAISLRFGDDGVDVAPVASSPATATTGSTTTAPTVPGRETDAAALLSVLGDDYTRRVLAAMGTEPLPARRIADRAGVSRPTVYRRLNRLAEVGIVTAATTGQPDGQDRQTYRVVVDAIECALIEKPPINTADVDATESGPTDVDATESGPADMDTEEGAEASDTTNDRQPVPAT